MAYGKVSFLGDSTLVSMSDLYHELVLIQSIFRNGNPSIVQARAYVCMVGCSEDAPELPPLRWLGVLGLGDRGTQGLRLDLLVRLLLLALAEDHRDGVLGLDAVHLHVVPALGDVVLVLHAVLERTDGLVPLMHDNDVLPAEEELDRVAPERGCWGEEFLKWRVGGIVHEEGEDAKREKRALRWISVRIGLPLVENSTKWSTHH